jgi:hypothetical protein
MAGETQVKRTAIINGTPYIDGVDIGNTSQLTVNLSYEEKSLPNYQGGGGNDDSFKRLTSANLTLAARNVSIATLEAALGGTATAETAAAVADEEHESSGAGLLVAIDGLQDLGEDLEIVVGTDDAVEGTDYTRKRAGIIPLAGGLLATAGTAFTASYKRHKAQRFQALLYTAQEKGLLFDGVNERTGNPWRARFFRVNWAPADSLELIGDDFATFTITGDILRDETRTGVGDSQFFELLVGDL